MMYQLAQPYRARKQGKNVRLAVIFDENTYNSSILSLLSDRPYGPIRIGDSLHAQSRAYMGQATC